MARLTYGGSIADFLFAIDDTDSDMEPAASGTVVTFYDALTGGNQYGPAPSPDDGTGLLDAAGAPAGSVTVDDDGYLPVFQGPDPDETNVTRLAADASGGAGPRRWIFPNDPVAPGRSAQQTAAAALTSITELAQTAPMYVYYNSVSGSYPQRPAGGSPVWWVGPVAPPFGGTGAVDGLDFWVGPSA